MKSQNSLGRLVGGIPACLSTAKKNTFLKNQAQLAQLAPEALGKEGAPCSLQYLESWAFADVLTERVICTHKLLTSTKLVVPQLPVKVGICRG